MKTTQSTPFIAFENEIKIARGHLFDQLDELPAPLRDAAKSAYEERLTRNDHRAMLGELAPWLISPLLPIHDSRVAETILPSWMSLYAYTLFVDDILDSEEKRKSAALMVASSLLLQRGLSSLLKQFPDDSLKKVIDSSFMEAASAVIDEINVHRDRHADFSEREIAQLGKKVALLKLCAVTLLLADGHADPATVSLHAIDKLATGMQLIDDLADWKEDWGAGNNTFILTETISRLRTMGVERKLDRDHLTANEVLLAAIITGGAEDSLSRATSLLRSSLQSAPSQPGNLAARRLLEAIISEHSTLLKDISTTRRKLMEARTVRLEDSPDWLRSLAGESDIQRQITFVDTRIRVVAQQS